MSSRPPNLTFKLVLLGDGRVGKTSLVLRYVNNVFSEKQEATVQASYLKKRLVIEDSDTFLRVKKWVEELQQMAPKNIVMAIAANKSDLVRSKKLNIQEAGSYAETIGAKLFVTSAKSGTGTDGVFLDIATRLMQKRKSNGEGLLPTPPRKGIIVIDDEPEKEPPPKCCS